MVGKGEWITLGKSQIRVSYLMSVTEEEAVNLLTSKVVHADKVRNAWKQANKYKSPNLKKVETKKKKS